MNCGTHFKSMFEKLIFLSTFSKNAWCVRKYIMAISTHWRWRAPLLPRAESREEAPKLSRQKKRWRRERGVGALGLFSFGFSFLLKEIRDKKGVFICCMLSFCWCVIWCLFNVFDLVLFDCLVFQYLVGFNI